MTTRGVTPRRWRKVLYAVLGMSLFGAGAIAIGNPAGADTPVPADGDFGNLPDNGSCGINGAGRWVKFPAGGGDGTGLTAKSGQPKWTATYDADSTSATFRVYDVTDENGKTITFNYVVGGVEHANPYWTFPPATSSPLLDTTHTGNFTQFALCAYPFVDFTVKKVVDWSGTTADPTKVFTIDVSCTFPGSSENKADPTQVQLKDGETATVKAPSGTSCNATDTATGFTTTSDGPKSLTVGSDVLITVTNTRQTGTIEVTKKVDVAPDTDAKFSFSLSCGSQTLDVTVKAGATEGKASFPTGVATGTSCTVTETAADSRYSVDGTPQTFTVKAGTNKLTFNNTRITGTVEVTKKVDVAPAGTAADFEFSLSCGSQTLKVTVPVGQTEGKGSFATAVATGTSCDVKETKADSRYSLDTSTKTITVVGGVNKLTFTNTRLTGTVEVTKTVDVAPAGTAADFEFSLSCGSQTLKISVPVGQTEGKASFPSSVLTGTSCDVKETKADSRYSLDGTTQTITIAEGVNKLTFANTRLTGTVEVTKKVDVAPAGTAADFEFSLSCGSQTLKITIAVGQTEGKASFPSSVLTGTSCDVKETKADSRYSLDTSTKTITVVSGVNKLTFTNTRLTGTLVVKKTNVDGPLTDTFSMSFSCTNGTGGSTTTAVGSRTGATVFTASGLPTGTVCTATETLAASSDYRLKSVSPLKAGTTDVGEITIGTGTNEIVLTNELKPADVKVVKTVSPGTVVLGGQATFTIVVTNLGPGTARGVTLTDYVPLGLSVATTNPTGILPTWNVGTLAPNASVTATITVDTPIVGIYKNCATVASTSPTDPDLTNNTSCATLGVGWMGRTPGYWKNHLGAWPGVNPNAEVVSVFSAVPSACRDIVAPSGNDTLVQALAYKGGSNLCGAVQILLRAAVASYLNEAQFGPQFPPYDTTKQLVAAVNTALASGDRGTILALATQLDGWNNGIH